MSRKILGIIIVILAFLIYTKFCFAAEIKGQVTYEIQNGMKIQVYEINGPFWQNPVTIFTDAEGKYHIDNLKDGQKYGIYPLPTISLEPEWYIEEAK